MDDATNNPALAVLTDAFERLRDGVPAVVQGLSTDELLWRPDPAANHVAWLLWHLSRQHDAQVAALADEDPVWTGEGWADRFALPYSLDAHGYGMSDADVAAFTVADAALFGAYQSTVHEATVRYLGALDAAAYDRVVDDRWDPPVTVGVRLVSVVLDGAKHLGQAEYVKGLLRRRRT
ncbi:MAG: DinB family protein [Humibacillus sp.]